MKSDEKYTPTFLKFLDQNPLVKSASVLSLFKYIEAKFCQDT